MPNSYPETPWYFFSLLANDVRWHLLEALSVSDRRVQELVALLDRPQNLVSYHLAKLRDAGLVSERRSTHDARDIYYRMELKHLQERYQSGANALHPAITQSARRKQFGGGSRRKRILFLCTQNSARSQMAEGIMRTMGGERVEAFSAGSEPRDVHPMAIEAMRSMKIDISMQQAKHMKQFGGQSFDYIITVCDRVREMCPVFPGDPQRIHWSFRDPAAVDGSREIQQEAFATIARELVTRIGYLLLVMEKT